MYRRSPQYLLNLLSQRGKEQGLGQGAEVQRLTELINGLLALPESCHDHNPNYTIYEFLMLTRLISIVSKLIKVVVVVIAAIVFVKKKIRSNNCGSKNNPSPKILGQKVLDPKKCG